MQVRTKKFLSVFLVTAAIVTVQAALVEVAVQQNYRQSANDPQVADAGDVVAALQQGAPVDAISQQTVDISTSLDVFPMAFDGTGKVVASGATLPGVTTLTVPSGVFTYAKKHGEDNFTWEPAKGVRIAAVVVPYTANNVAGYVLMGRNIELIEQRERALALIVLVAWVIELLLALLLTEIVVGGMTRWTRTTSGTVVDSGKVVGEYTVEEHVTVEKM